MRVLSATALPLAALAVLAFAFAVPAAAATSSFCYIGSGTVGGHEVNSGWLLCCDGDIDDPTTWRDCHYGKWWPNPPPIEIKMDAP